METAEKPNKVLDHIKELIEKPKQYADRIFEEPPKPSFLNDDEEEEEDEIVDELREVETQEEAEAEAFEIESEQDLSFYAGGFLAVLTFGIEKLLSVMNGTEPEEYELDKHEEKHLRKQAVMMMKAKKIKAKPSTWFYLTLGVIYGQAAVTGIFNTGKRIFGWFKGRGAKKEEAAKLAAAEAAKAQELSQAQAQADYERNLIEMEKRIRDEVKQELTREQPKATTPKTKATKAKLDIPDQSQFKAPTLEQLASKHNSGLCLAPGCAKPLGKNEFFHANPCRIAYTGASQRKEDPFPKTEELKKYLTDNPETK